MVFCLTGIVVGVVGGWCDVALTPQMGKNRAKSGQKPITIAQHAEKYACGVGVGLYFGLDSKSQ